jgi:hypothetical protein
MQPVDDLKLHQFFFRRAKNLVLLEVAHVPMRASHSLNSLASLNCGGILISPVRSM